MENIDKNNRLSLKKKHRTPINRNSIVHH